MILVSTPRNFRRHQVKTVGWSDDPPLTWRMPSDVRSIWTTVDATDTLLNVGALLLPPLRPRHGPEVRLRILGYRRSRQISAPPGQQRRRGATPYDPPTARQRAGCQSRRGGPATLVISRALVIFFSSSSSPFLSASPPAGPSPAGVYRLVPCSRRSRRSRRSSATRWISSVANNAMPLRVRAAGRRRPLATSTRIVEPDRSSALATSFDSRNSCIVPSVTFDRFTRSVSRMQ